MVTQRTGGVPWTDLVSACPEESHRTANRVDPYWAGMWSMSTTAAWLSRATAERQAGMGLLRVPVSASGLGMSDDEARVRIVGNARRRRLTQLAAIGMWRTATVQQVAALTGQPAIAGRHSVDRDVLWAAGLTEQGVVVTSLRSKLPTLLRPDPRGDWDELAQSLTFAERVSVTGGQPWRWGAQYDRHNVLATELGLRVAEFAPVATVLGESLAGVDLLLGGTGRSGAGSRSGDMVIVRPDGFKIVIEVTATVTSDFREKVRRWANVLTARRQADLGVCFVELAHPDRRDASTEVHRLLRRAVTEAAHSGLDAEDARVPELFSVARWQEWFPEPGRVDPDFTRLRAWRPIGPRGEPWESVDLADPSSLRFRPPTATSRAATEVIVSNAAMLWGTPYWTRVGMPAPDVNSGLLDQAGLSGLVVTPRRPRREPLVW